MLGTLWGCAPAIMRALLKEIRKHEIDARNARELSFLCKSHNEMTFWLKLSLKNTQTAAEWSCFSLIFDHIFESNM